MRRIWRDEGGMALPMVIGTLTLMLGISVMATQEAVHLGATSTADRNSKAALAAAQAGAQAAQYRIAKIGPADNMCVTNVAVAPLANGKCPGFTQALGNGASYTYYTTPRLGASATCAGSAAGTSTQRCITSTGVADGTKRRVQLRVKAAPGLLPVQGMLGLEGVEAGNNSTVAGNVGSNGVVKMGNNSAINRADLGPTATLLGNPQQAQPLMRNAVDFTLPPVPIEGTETANNNAAIPPAPGYAPGSRSLTLNSDLVLPAGDYNFCKLKLDGGLNAAPGATVRIFIDAPDAVRPASGCPNGNGWGEIDGKNGVSLGQPNGVPAALQIYIHGWPKDGPYATQYGRSIVDVAKNNLDANALIYAPQTFVNVAKNNASIKGAVAAEEIYVKNNLDFTWDSGLESLGGGQYTRSAWRECRSDPAVPTDPESGCS